MPAVSNRRSILSLAVAGLLFTSVACDNFESEQRKSNRVVNEAVKNAVEQRRKAADQQTQIDEKVIAGDNTDQIKASLEARNKASAAARDQAIKELQRAVGETGAALPNKIEARSLLAQQELESGNALARELSLLAPQIDRSLWEVRQTAAQIEAITKGIESLNASNPKPNLDTIAAKRGEVAAQSDAAAKAAADLQSKIDAIKTQIKTLTDQKTAAQQQADADAEKASKLSGKEAVALLNTVTENRRKASNLGHDMDRATAALLPLERDLAVEQGKKTNADAAIAALDESKKTIEANWQAIQTQLGEQKNLQAKLNDELGKKAVELEGHLKQAADLRAKAIKQYEDAAKHYGAAATDATALGKTLAQWEKKEGFTNVPERAAWKRLRELYNFNAFWLFEGQARAAIGDVNSTAASQLGARQQVATATNDILQKAGLTVPASLSASMEAEQQKALKDATEAYTEASKRFESVYGFAGNPKFMQDAAHIARMFSLYSQYLNGDKDKLNEARKEFQATYGGAETKDPIIKTFPADLQG